MHIFRYYTCIIHVIFIYNTVCIAKLNKRLDIIDIIKYDLNSVIVTVNE